VSLEKKLIAFWWRCGSRLAEVCVLQALL